MAGGESDEEARHGVGAQDEEGEHIHHDAALCEPRDQAVDAVVGEGEEEQGSETGDRWTWVREECNPWARAIKGGPGSHYLLVDTLDEHHRGAEGGVEDPVAVLQVLACGDQAADAPDDEGVLGEDKGHSDAITWVLDLREGTG